MSGALFEWSPAQRRAIETEGRDILVAAGAGAGKTTVLVERILRKLRDRTILSLDDLLVVTFTEKAARQMRSRIYEALVGDPELRHFVPQLPRARIATIHAYCARLLRENFLEAEVEPAFRVMDEHGSTEATEEAMQETFHHWYGRKDRLGEEFERLVELAGFDENGESLKLIVRRLYDFARTTPVPEAYLEGLSSASEDASTLHESPPLNGSPAPVEDLLWWPEFRSRIELDLRSGLALYREAIGIAELAGKNCGKNRILLEALESAGADPRRLYSRLDAQGVIGDKFTVNWSASPAPRGSGKLPGFAGAHDAAKKRINRAVQTSRIPDAVLLEEEERRRLTMTILVSLVREMRDRYETYKGRHGFLDFSDLETRTANMLREAAAQGRQLARFQEVMVDEYQDVNGLQAGILDQLARGGQRFRVGDVKQSIYGFRLADPTIFLSEMEGSEFLGEPELDSAVPSGPPSEPDSVRQSEPRETSDPDPAGRSESSGASESDAVPVPATIFMNENHRSRPEILQIVNQIFGFVFDPETIGSDYERQRLVASRSKLDEPTPVELHLVDTGPSRDCAGVSDHWMDPTEIQPRWVARRVAALADDSALLDGEGNPDWSRVAILLRSSTRAEVFVRELHRLGVPAHFASGGSLLEETSVRDLVSLLSVIDNPRNDIALAATLRSPAFGFGAADLLKIRLAFPGAVTFLDALIGVAAEEEDSSWVGVLVPPHSPGSSAPGTRADWTGPPRRDWESVAGRSLPRRSRRFLDRLSQWRGREPREELRLFIMSLVDELHLVPIAFGSGEGPRQRASLERLFELARDFETERGPSLRGFLSRLDTLEEAKALRSSFEGQEERAVQILTVHKAKGLEFPIVVVPQLEWRLSTKDRLASRIRIDRDWVGVRWFDPETYTRRESQARQLLEWRQEGALREEEARILYVALTRAEEKLLLFGSLAKKERIYLETADGTDGGERLSSLMWSVRREEAASAQAWLLDAFDWKAAQALEDGQELSRMALDFDRELTYSELAQENGIEPQLLPKKSRAEIVPTSRELKLGPLRILVVAKAWAATRLKDAAPSPGPAVLSAHDRLSAWLAKTDDRTNRVGGTEPGDTPPAGTVPADTVPAGTASAGTAPADTVPAVAAPISAAQRVLQRVGQNPTRPRLADLQHLRGKYWVTEFKSPGDSDRRSQLEEDGTSFWIDPIQIQGGAAEDGVGSGTAAPKYEIDPGVEQPLEKRAEAPAEVGAGPSGAETGLLYHSWLARMSFPDLTSGGFDDALERARNQSWWSEEARDREIERGIQGFFDDPWGQILSTAQSLDREVSFSLKWTVRELMAQVPLLAEEVGVRTANNADWAGEVDRQWVLLQGRLDCVFQSDGRWYVLDWKTDRVRGPAVEERARVYESQMSLYRQAVSRLWGGPVSSVLVFLRSGEVRRTDDDGRTESSRVGG